jgi:hypothetical protein
MQSSTWVVELPSLYSTFLIILILINYMQDKLRLGACTLPVQISDEEKLVEDSCNDVMLFDHCANSHVATSEVLQNWLNDIVPDHFLDCPDVQCSQWVLVHECVHGRVDICWCCRS